MKDREAVAAICEAARNTGLAAYIGEVQLLAERFHNNYIPVTECGCWLWIGNADTKGYGRMKILDIEFKAHRLSLMLVGIDVPPDALVCHKCDVPGCVNPSHLFLGTAKDNHDDMVRKGRRMNNKGERHPLAKLTDDDVREILTSNTRSRLMAKKLNVSESLICMIRQRKNWGHIHV